MGGWIASPLCEKLLLLFVTILNCLVCHGSLAVLAVAPVKSFAYHHLCKMYSDYITPHCMFSIYAKAHEHQLGSKKPSQVVRSIE